MNILAILIVQQTRPVAHQTAVKICRFLDVAIDQ